MPLCALLQTNYSDVFYIEHQISSPRRSGPSLFSHVHKSPTVSLPRTVLQPPHSLRALCISLILSLPSENKYFQQSNQKLGLSSLVFSVGVSIDMYRLNTCILNISLIKLLSVS